MRLGLISACRLEIFVARLPEQEGVLAGEVLNVTFFLGKVAVVVVDLQEDRVCPKPMRSAVRRRICPAPRQATRGSFQPVTPSTAGYFTPV